MVNKHRRMCRRQRQGPFVVLVVAGILFAASAGAAFALDIKGFMDVTYQQSPSNNAEAPLKHGAFALGGLDLFIAHDINDRLDVISELVFEAPGGGMIVDLERIEIGYSFNDWLNVRMGRFHPPLGHYSSAYHHGRHLDGPIMRPLVLEFEDTGGLIPGHLVGLQARGDVKAGYGTAKYVLAVVNGHSIDVDNRELVLNMTSDDNVNKSVAASLSFEPGFIEGAGIGASMYSGRLTGYSASISTTVPNTPVARLDQLILGANIYYDKAPLQFMAEYYLLRDKDVFVNPGKKYAAAGYFIQAAYEFSEKYSPYVRYEGVNREAGDPYAGNLLDNDVKRFTYGLKYNICPESSLKLEGIAQTTGADKSDIFGLQWAYMF